VLPAAQGMDADLRLLRLARAPLIAVSAGLLIASFPPFSAGEFCAWVALVPLLFALRGLRPIQAALAGGIWSMLANAGIFAWLIRAEGFRWYHFLALDALYSTFAALWCGSIARLGIARRRDVLVAAALWVLLEYGRAHAGFLALPLATLAQTQLDDTGLMQLGALAGEPGVSFMVVLGNLLLARALIAKQTAMLWRPVAGIVLVAVAGALIVLSAASPEQNVRGVAALDTHFAVGSRHKLAHDVQLQATLQELAQGMWRDTTLAVLPESSFTGAAARQRLAMRDFVDVHRVALVAGVSQVAKFERSEPAQTSSALPLRVRNAAWLLTPGTHEIQRYEKAVRMPFAEYLPLSQWIAWPHWLVGYPLEVIPGPGPEVFTVDAQTRPGMMICWEALVSAHGRALARDGATLLVVVANDGWFGSRNASLLQGLAARMRAVETRRPVVLAANGGVSMVIDRFGRVVARASGGTQAEWLRASIAMDTAQTPYTRCGDLFVALCALVVMLSAWREAREKMAPGSQAVRTPGRTRPADLLRKVLARTGHPLEP
jgi:apolipoprotein N-acyltransferase